MLTTVTMTQEGAAFYDAELLVLIKEALKQGKQRYVSILCFLYE